MLPWRGTGDRTDELVDLIAGLQRTLEALDERVRELSAQIAESAERTREALGPLGVVAGEQGRVLQALQVLYDDEPGNRRRLYALRASAEYEVAFSEETPLVSVIIPTYTGWRTLRDRALPSVLAQTYPNIEVVIVGDAAPPETAAMLEELGDPRVRYRNLPYRGPYPDDPDEVWLVSGVPPFNAAMRDARGRWIAPFADDDALLPDTIEAMVAAVKEHRHEVCYGKLRAFHKDGVTIREVGEFPPAYSRIGLQGGVFHAGLRFTEQELADVIFRMPNDWQMMRRWLRIGVRVGFLDRIVCDYYPSRF
jgi:Glycosyl transferase family 2